MLTAFIVSTVFITLAELGDKTQLLALALAAKYRASQVLLGVFVATLVVHLLSTVAGGVVGGLVPEFWLKVGTGLLFVLFGLWTLRGDTVDDENAAKGGRFGPVVTTGIAFFLAEIGDKTQIMTMTIAADPGAALQSFPWLARVVPAGAAPSGAGAFLGVWMGSTLGMVIADGIAILIGAVLGKKLPERLITRVSGAIFILFGAVTLVAALRR